MVWMDVGDGDFGSIGLGDRPYQDAILHQVNGDRMRKTLTPQAEREAVALYALRDERGKPMYSQLEIACQLGVSETTIFRLLKREAMKTSAPMVNRESAAVSEESLRRRLIQTKPVAAISKAPPVFEPYGDLPEEELVRPDEDDQHGSAEAQRSVQTTLPHTQVSKILHEVCNLPVEPGVLTKMKGYLGS